MRKGGFTYIEIMIVITIVVLLSTMFFAAYKTFSRRQTLKKESFRFAKAFDSARKSAAAKYAYCPAYTGTYQVSWTTTTYTVTPAGCSAQLSYTLPSQVTLDLAGSVTYKTIGLNTAGECVLMQDAATSQCRKITISTSGVVDEQLEADCACP